MLNIRVYTIPIIHSIVFVSSKKMVIDEIGKLFRYCQQHPISINIFQLVARISQGTASPYDARLFLSESFGELTNEYYKIMQLNL